MCTNIEGLIPLPSPDLCLADPWSPTELCHLTEWNSPAQHLIQLLRERNDAPRGVFLFEEV